MATTEYSQRIVFKGGDPLVLAGTMTTVLTRARDMGPWRLLTGHTAAALFFVRITYEPFLALRVRTIFFPKKDRIWSRSYSVR